MGLVALLAAGLGAPVVADGLKGPVAANVTQIVDGDTIGVTAQIWLGQTLMIHVRIAGIDTPELKARCAREQVQAEAAQSFLRKRLTGAQIRLSDISYDKYGGRVLAHVADAGGDIGEALVAAGLARRYGGGARLSWCG